MECITIDPLTDERWNLLINARSSSIFHSREWIRVLVNTYDFDIKANILVNPDNANVKTNGCTNNNNNNNGGAAMPLCGLPFCKLGDIRGNRISALPFCDYMDPIVDTLEQWNQLVAPIIDAQLPFKTRPLYNTIPLNDSRFAKNSQAHWHGLELAPSLDDLWAGLHGAVRTAVRKALKNGVVVQTTTDKTALEAFYNLHVGIRKNKYRMVAQPYNFFQNIWEELIARGYGKIVTATFDEKIIAATIFLQWKGTLYYKFNASDPGMLWLNPNELLLWEGIKYGKELECQLMDFGLSDWEQDGLIFYKRKFSDLERTISFLQYAPDTSPALACGNKNQIADVGSLLPKLTDLFTDESVPDQIAKKAGELLYRYFA